MLVCAGDDHPGKSSTVSHQSEQALAASHIPVLYPSSVGRRTEHAGQTTITLTGQHAYFDKARQLLMHISSQLQAWVSAAAEQFDGPSVWLRCCAHLKRTLAAIGPPKPHRLLAEHANGVG